ncbi:hypothetical protein K7G98_37375, partial [Saccharothrix sp. MB29]|nr:hypothetical protein [Saccharothrix sp. MB29]
MATVELAAGSVFDQPFGVIQITGYLDRPGGTVSGYAGTDVVTLNFLTPEGRRIPARVEAG